MERQREEDMDATGTSAGSGDTTADREAVERVKQSMRDQESGGTGGASGGGGGGGGTEDAEVIEQAETRQSINNALEDAGVNVRRPSQGVEHGGGPAADQASQFERDVAVEAGLGTEDIAVNRETRDGEEVLVPELTRSGRATLRQRRRGTGFAGPTPLDILSRAGGSAVGRVRRTFSDRGRTTRGFDTRARRTARGAVDRMPTGGGGAASQAPVPAQRAVSQTPEGVGELSTTPRRRTAAQGSRMGLRPAQQPGSQTRDRSGTAADDVIVAVRRGREQFGRAFDKEILLETTSPGSSLFGTADRERAIEQEAVEGSTPAQIFVGGESLEQVGVEGSRILDEQLPRFDDPVTVDAQIVTKSGEAIDAQVDFNPRVGPGGVRVGEQARNVVRDAPTAFGVVAGTGPKIVGDIGLRAEDVLGGDVADEATISTGSSVAALKTAGGNVKRAAKEEPVGFAIGFLGPAAVSKVSPVRFQKFDVPTKPAPDADVSPTLTRRAGAASELIRRGESPTRVRGLDLEPSASQPTTTVHGLRLEKPAVLQRVGSPGRGTTLTGSRGLRVSRGAPTVDAGDIDLSRMGGRAGRTTEPVDPFETDVLQATARGEGGTTAARAEAVEVLISDAARQRVGGRTVSAEEMVSEVRAVPESKTSDVVQALQETDATVFGSAAVRGQVEGFRTPRDLDVVVPDKGVARDIFSESLEGTGATVSDVFDIKEVGDAPGRARGGERIKFGRASRRKLTTEEGVRVNPVEEELVRKAGAAGFFREPGAAGTAEFDVGPEPRRPGRLDVREKDVTDAITIGREVLGPESASVRQFEEAFGFRDPTPEVPQPGVTGQARLELAEFLAEERAQGTLVPGGRSGQTGSRAVDDVVDTGTGRAPRDADATRPVRSDFDSPSPGRAVDADGPSPSVVGGTTATSPTSPGVTGGDGSPGVASPGGADAVDSPLGPPGGGGPGGSPPGSPTGDDPIETGGFIPSVSDDSPPGSPTGDDPITSGGFIPSVGDDSPPGGGPGPGGFAGAIGAVDPTQPTRRLLDPDVEADDKRRFGLRFGGDFAKTFEAEIATEETVQAGTLDDLSDPGSFNEGGSTVIDEDLSTHVVEVTGDPPEDGLDDLVREFESGGGQ